MQIIESSAEGLKRAYRIKVDAKDIGARLESRILEISRTVRMPGFRPGKVPASLVRKSHAKALMGEILQDTVDQTTRETLEQNNLTPALQPRIEIIKFGENDDLEFSIEVEVLPEIEPGEFKDISLERVVAPITDAEVDEALTGLANQQKRFATAEKVAENGNAVLIDFLGRIDGTPFEGGAGEDFELELGSGRFIPGFEEQLVGVQAGDKRDVTVTFPEDYPAKEFAGKPAVFEVTVKEVRAAADVTVDDAFATSLGLENLEKLKELMKGQLERTRGGLTRQKLKRSLLDALAERHTFEVPPGLVNVELETILRQAGVGAGAAGVAEGVEANAEAAAAAVDPEVEAKRAEFMPIAERRVRLGLLLAEVGRRQNLQVKPEELNRAIAEQARQFPGQEKAVFDYFRNDQMALAQLRAPLLEDKVIDYILELAQVTERQVSFDELRADGEDDGETA
jgi:trigger factor